MSISILRSNIGSFIFGSIIVLFLCFILFILLRKPVVPVSGCSTVSTTNRYSLIGI